jgi:surface protein
MMIKSHSIRFILFIILFTYNLQGQNLTLIDSTKSNLVNLELCGTDSFHNQKMKNDAEYKVQYLKSIQKSNIQQLSVFNGVYQIPVVVHVMHKGESLGSGTNISDDDVKKGVEYLNNYWRKILNSPGYGDGVDMKIEFVLAVQDENGNSTNGIDRVDMSAVSSYMNNGVNATNSNGLSDYSNSGGINSLKEYARWDPNLFYNVYLVDEIDNKNCYSGGSYTAGYAYYSSSHGEAWDGSVVLICSFLNKNSTTWAHEMGHAFNLPHTFLNDHTNINECGDDLIPDTPKHKRTSSISPSIYFDCDNSDVNDCDPNFNQIINPDTGFRRNSGTHQDHIHNYMDYTGCPTEFTGGQRTVAYNSLQNDRASYINSKALVPSALAMVDFATTSNICCVGNLILFKDTSSSTPNSYTNSGNDTISFQWTFDNGIDTPIISTLQNPSITFLNAGVYDVTLQVTNIFGTSSLKKEAYIIVQSGTKNLVNCNFDSQNKDGNFGCGVTKVSLNTLNNTTSTFIPSSAVQDFTCSNNTILNKSLSYQLNVDYTSISNGNQNLEVWIDWDNSGTFERSNSFGNDELVMEDTILANRIGYPSATITPPSNSIQNKLLRMRVISEVIYTPNVCGLGFAQRADDYGIYVESCSIPSTVEITNNSATLELTCSNPIISLTASGGVNYSWDNNLGNTASVFISNPGLYTVTVTSNNGCISTKSITITENKVNCNSDDSFITTWETTTSNESITILPQADAPNYIIDWGDGTITSYTATSSPTHTYASPGEHSISINGSFTHLRFDGRTQLKGVTQWGTCKWTSMERMFDSCTNFNSLPSTSPDLSLCTNMYAMFNGASSFNQPIGNWNVSNVTNMGEMFSRASSFNQPIGDWNVRNATNMRDMFSSASSFNQPIGNWDVSNVGNMNNLFSRATSFNQPIGNWNVSNVTTMSNMFSSATSFNQPIGNWDVSNVTNMQGMFTNATSFNQPISNWNVFNITNMLQMFTGAILFNQPIGNWDVSNVTDMRGMFDGVTLETTNYDNLLTGWTRNGITLKQGVTLGGGNSKYCNGILGRNILITTYGWTVNDAGQDCFTIPYDNFTIETKSETCLGKKNGEITIKAKATYDYVATIGDKEYAFVNNSLTLSNLLPDDYRLCIGVKGQSFEQCFNLTIAKGGSLTGKSSSLSSNQVIVDISEGTVPFEVLVNGKYQFETNQTSFTVNAKNGDLLVVKSAIVCEGIFSKTILDGPSLISLYPNPTSGEFEIGIPEAKKEIYVELYSINSVLISSGTYPLFNHRISLDIKNESAGIYFAKVYTESPISLIVIKK